MYCLNFIFFLMVIFSKTKDVTSDRLNRPLKEHRDKNAAKESFHKVIRDSLATIINDFPLPSFDNPVNNVELVDKFIPEFEIGYNNEDVYLSLEGLLRKYNRTYEIHNVTTQDGYILKMFRIPGGGKPVLLVPGLLESADDFATAGPNSGLIYKLSDQNSDVWVGNPRGTKYSRNHIYLKPSSAQFWDFSWHEIGIFDLPALIDYILYVTRKPSLTYIGHSQGTTSFFVLTSERPEYNKKVNKMAALSPVGYLSHTKSILIKFFSLNKSFIVAFLKSFGIYELFADNRFTRLLKNILCSGLKELSLIICINAIVFPVIGYSNGQLNITNLPVIFSHFLTGTSIKLIDHYGQEVNSGKFAKYNYGLLENLKIYGTAEPPEYDLSQITTPVYFFRSDGDWLAQPKDVDKLAKRINSIKDIYKVPLQDFNHLDFLFAKDVVPLVYEKLLNTLEIGTS